VGETNTTKRSKASMRKPMGTEGKKTNKTYEKKFTKSEIKRRCRVRASEEGNRRSPQKDVRPFFKQ